MEDTQQQAGNQSQSVQSQTTSSVQPVAQTGNTVFQFIKPQSTATDDQAGNQQVTTPTQEEKQQVSIPAVGKEGEPLPALDTTKWVEASEPEEIEVPPEAAEMGVQSVPQTPPIPEEVRKAGVTYSPPMIPIAGAQTSDRIKLPMTEEEAKKVIAHPQPSSSLYWLALTMLRQIEWLKHNLQEKQV